MIVPNSECFAACRILRSWSEVMQPGRTIKSRAKGGQLIMDYIKPEIIILGDATCVIEYIGKPFGNSLETAMPHYRYFDPAYDLDE